MSDDNQHVIISHATLAVSPVKSYKIIDLLGWLILEQLSVPNNCASEKAEATK